MSKLKCKTVGAGFENFYTVGKVYNSDADACVTDNESVGDDWYHWDLESDGVTVREHCCDDSSRIVATFEIAEE